MTDYTLASAAISAVSGITGALGANVYAGWRQDRSIARQQSMLSDQQRVELAFQMHRDFNTTLFHEARVSGGLLVGRVSKEENLQALLDKSPNEAQSLVVVLNFYLRLWFAVKHGRVDEPIALDLFGSNFTWWWERCFKEGLPDSWDSRNGIVLLERWLAREATPSQLDEWRKMAMN